MRYIACFGDSLVEGFPFGPEHSWTASAEKHSGIKILNYGVCGACCDDIFYRMSSAPMPEHVRHLIFFGGANDALEGRMWEHVLRDFEAAAQWALERGYKLGFVLPLISGEEFVNVKLRLLRQHLTDNFGGRNFLLDLQPALESECPGVREAYLDGVHPKASIHEAMGIYAAPLLEKWLAKG